MRGVAASYTDAFVRAYLHFGILEMRGVPGFLLPGENGMTVLYNWHHPPLYGWYITCAAQLLGHEPWVLRAAHLLLWVPSIGILYGWVRANVGPMEAGAAALLFVGLPMVGYFGPMVLPEGAVTSAGLSTLWLFHRHLQAPRPTRLAAAAVAYFLTCQLDFTGSFWGVGAFVMAVWLRRDPVGLRAVGCLFLVSVLSFGGVVFYYGMALDGPGRMLKDIATIAVGASGKHSPVDAQDVVRSMVAWRDLWVGWPYLLLAVVGAVLAITKRCWTVLVMATAVLAVGAASCLAFPRHAVIHEFWPLQAMAGLALAAAAVPGCGVRLWLVQPGSRRFAGAVLVTATAAIVAWGTAVTHRVVASRATAWAVAQTPETVELSEFLAGCAVALTYDKVQTRGQFAAILFYSGIDTREALDTMVKLGRSGPVRGTCAYVLPIGCEDPALHAYLEPFGPPRRGAHWVVYRIPF